MTEPEMQDRSDTPAPQGPIPAQGSTERMFLRLSFWQTLLSVVGVFIAVIALYAALTESEAVRQQTAAAVWPFVQVSVADYDSPEAAGFTLSFRNAGVGPALMRGLRVSLAGQPMRDLAQIVALLGGSLDDGVGRTAVTNRVLSPGEQIDLIEVTQPQLARQFQAVIAHPDTAVSYCYCSIFDDCWVADSRRAALDPTPVDECPDFGDTAYRQ